MWRASLFLVSRPPTVVTAASSVSVRCSTRTPPRLLAACYCTTPSLSMPLDEFRDKVPRQQRMSELVGRSWSARELRRKSFDDLHKLWLVLYKEKNMLLTEQQLSRRKQIIFPQPERLKKVGKSLGAIRQVLGERKQERIQNRIVNGDDGSESENKVDMAEQVKEQDV